MAPRSDAYIGLGSNLSDPQQQLLQALKALSQLPQTELVASSSLYRSAPMGPPDQPDYINAVAHLITELGPYALLDQIQTIELAQGRTRDGERWGARTLDLDLLLYGDGVIVDDRLQVPHPGLHERAFVLYPLYEITTDLVIPGQGALDQLVKKCPAEGLEKMEQ